LRLFEDTKTSGQVMAIKFQVFTVRYGIYKKVLIYAKDEGANLGAMTTTTLKAIVSYESLRLKKPFQSTCFGHTILKAC
jgi:hypothetical protein